MGKTRDLFKKFRDTKGTFHARMGLIKDRNGLDLTEAEDIKKRWQEYTENCTKKIFTTQNDQSVTFSSGQLGTELMRIQKSWFFSPLNLTVLTRTVRGFSGRDIMRSQ